MARYAQDQRAALFLADYCHSLNRLSQGFVDLCDAHPVTRVGRAIAQGVVDSAYNHLTYALEHPAEAALDLGVLLFAPEFTGMVALCRLAAFAHHAYQHRKEVCQATRQFFDDIQKNAHYDPEWLAQNGKLFTQVLCDIVVIPYASNKIMNTGGMRPLANGLRRQTEAVQACIRNGVNAAGQKACDGLKNILQNAGEALKTGNPQPAFAGVPGNASLRAVDDQANRAAQGLMKKVGDATGLQKSHKAGTVWDSIKTTDVFYSKTKIPKSFELAIGNQKIWVNPNATKHMVEYITLARPITHGMPISSQTLLRSFKSAVEKSMEHGIQYTEKPIFIDCWELIFSPPRGEGLFPVIKHAVYRP